MNRVHHAAVDSEPQVHHPVRPGQEEYITAVEGYQTTACGAVCFWEHSLQLALPVIGIHQQTLQMKDILERRTLP